MSTASSAQKLTTTDALSYLKAVKEKFLDSRDKYNNFIDVMKGFKDQRINTSTVISKVKELFKGDQDLILGFNAFLPKGYEITLPLEDEPFPKKKPVEFEEAVRFVNKIKFRFQGNDGVNKAFLDILNMYTEDYKSITEIYQKVSVLFKDHADLLVEFTHFLPDTSGAAPVHYAQPGKNHIMCQDDRSSPMTMTPVHIEKPAGSSAVRVRHVDFPDTKQWNPVEEEHEKLDERDKINWEYNDGLDCKRKSSHKDDHVTDQFCQGLQDPVSTFCEKVKERLQDSENYKKFLDCIRTYGSKLVTTSQFQMLVANLLGMHPDLMEECEHFIASVEKTGWLQNNKPIIKSLKVKDCEGHDQEDREKNKDDENIERDRNGNGLAFNAKDIPGQKLSAVREKFMVKPIQELDFSKCKCCTPSYRILPENYPIPTASCRTKIGAEVLNDQWVSVTSGSEDSSFKHMRKNQYEESLFCCEDDRFELDMLLESVKTTVKRVQELLGSIDVHTNNPDVPFHIENHLTVLNLRCIERLYGDHGLDVMDALRKNAPSALPVILTRLKQKQTEWEKCRFDFNQIWADIYAKNYHKSLDHRSFYFKQQDAKNLSTKALLAEIRDISEKNQNEEEIILSVGAAYRQPAMPHMKFDYADPHIQEDLYQLIKYTSGVVCTPEQHGKIMKIWTTFVEPVLSVPSHPSVENVVHIVNTNNHAAKNFACIGEESVLPVVEASSEGKSPDMSKTGLENIRTDQSCSSRVLMSNSENGVKNDGCHIGAIKQSGLFEQVTPSASGENCVNNKNALITSSRRDGANDDCGIEAMTNEESLGDVTRKFTSSSLEDTVSPRCRKETEGCSKTEREEGELSPNRNIEENNFAAFGNCGPEIAQDSIRSAANTRRNGDEDLCIVEAGRGTDANVENESEKISQGASDREDTSEGEMASGENCSPEDPDADGDRNENENKAENEEEADVIDTEVYAFSDHLLRTVKPLMLKTPIALPVKENSEIFYGNDSFYLLFRLHQMLYERMRTAKLHSLSPENKWRISNDADPADSYTRFKDALHSLLDGSSDNAKFEDECRAIVGSQSYILFTLDKLILKLVKQLQIIASEEMGNKLLQLYAYERSRNPEKFVDSVYLENARFLLTEDNIYRMEYVPSATQLSIQLIKNEHDIPKATAVYLDPVFAAYLHGRLLSDVPKRKGKPTIFLERNKRKFSTRDEISDTCKAMEGLITYNGLEVKVSCNSSKASYIMDTEDLLYRIRKRRRTM